MIRRPALLVLTAVALVVAACGGSDTADTGSSATSSAAATPEATTEATNAATTQPTETSQVTAPLGAPLVTAFDPTSMTLLTDHSGGGLHPLLAWDAVDGASFYAVKLYIPDGAPYWAWQGVSTSIHVGGEPQLLDHAEGPFIADGMTWGVIAYDADWGPVAASERRPIAP